MIKQSIEDMERYFASAVLAQGRYYHENNYIVNTRISDGLLHARVRSNERHIYDVYINIKTWPTQPARCTCATTTNCKHAAACLMDYQLGKQQRVVERNSNSTGLKTLTRWLSNLPYIKKNAPKNLPSADKIIYVLESSLQDSFTVLRLDVAVAKRLKKGGYGKLRFMDYENSVFDLACDPADTKILSELSDSEEGLFSTQAKGLRLETLERMLDTQRLHNPAMKPYELGKSNEAVLQWDLCENGMQRLQLHGSNGALLHPLLLDVVAYIDKDTLQIGRVFCPYSPEELRLLLNMAPVAFEQLEKVRDFFNTRYPDISIPDFITKPSMISPKPRLALKFYAYDYNAIQPNHLLSEAQMPEGKKEDKVLYYCIVEYDYAGSRIHEDSAENNGLFVTQGDNVYEIKRDKEAEEALLDKLSNTLAVRRPIGDELWTPVPFHKSRLLASYQAKSDVADIMNHLFPQLEGQGFILEKLHALYQETISVEDVDWYSDASDGNQFFSFQLGIVINGQAVNIVPLVAHYILNESSLLEEENDDFIINLALSSDKTLQVPLGRVRPLIRLITHYGAKRVIQNEAVELKPYQYILLQEIEAAAKITKVRWQGQTSIREQLTQLQDKSLPEASIPKGLQTPLRDYQRLGLSWLQFLRQHNFSGILADDMGLGKTIQTLAHLLLEKEQGRLQRPALIIAPTSLVYNWYNEAKRFTPALKVLVFHGAERHQDSFSEYDIVISTYGLVQRDKLRFCSYNFYYVILDEAQFIKNSRTKTTQIIQQLNAEHRFCLSGTPLENHLGELWSLFNFLMPGLLGDARQFRQQFRWPIEKENDFERQTILSGRVHAFILRRTKKEVATELPLKTEMTRTVQLYGPQRDLYEGIRLMMEKKVRDAIVQQGLGKSQIVLLDALLKLRQVCCDPRLVKLEEAKMAHGSSAKLELLLELVDNLMEEGRSVLIFSQFTSMLSLIESEIQQRGLKYLKLTGATRNRQALVDTFQEGNIPIFLISLKAGGTGLNLTKADTVIHYDPWWNPAVEDQATDRTHRIGQTNPVFVYRLITEGTVEEVILQMQDKKRQLVDGIFQAQATGNFALSEDDIQRFFAALD